MARHGVFWVVAAALVAIAVGRVMCAEEAGTIAPAERLKEIAAAQTDKHLVQELQHAVKRPDSPYTFMGAVERAHNLGDRALALEIIDIGEALGGPGERDEFLRMRRAIWRYEADVESLEESYWGPIEEAIAHSDVPFPDDIRRDRVMLKRLLPRCMAAFAADPGNTRFFEFLERSFSRVLDDDSRERVLRLRLAVQPAAASSLARLLQESGRHQEVLTLTQGPIPRGRETIGYRLVRADALIALGGMDDAIAVADELVEDTADTGFYWQQIAPIYVACGQKDKAIGLVKQRASPGNSDAAKILADCGDADGVRAVVEQAIERGEYALGLMECWEVCRVISDEALAERAFDAAEKAAVERVRRSRDPLFDFPYDVRCYYERAGRMERLAAALLPLYPEEKRAAFIVRLAKGSMIRNKRPQGIALMEKYREAYGEDPEFRRSYEWMLRVAQTAEERSQAATSAASPSRPQPPPPPDPQQAATEIAALRMGLVKEPDDASAHAQLGLLLMRAGDVEAGRAEVRRAVALGAGCSLLGRMRFLPSCLDGIDESPSYRIVLNTYLAKGLRAEFEEDVAPLLARTPAHRAAHLQAVAWWFGRQGRQAEAEAVLQQARALNPYVGVYVRW